MKYTLSRPSYTLNTNKIVQKCENMYINQIKTVKFFKWLIHPNMLEKKISQTTCIFLNRCFWQQFFTLILMNLKMFLSKHAIQLYMISFSICYTVNSIISIVSMCEFCKFCQIWSYIHWILAQFWHFNFTNWTKTIKLVCFPV